MDRPHRRRPGRAAAALVALAGLLATSRPVWAIPDFADVHGRKCSPARYKGQIYMLVVANKDNEPEAYRATVAMTLKHLDKDFQPVVVFDLRTLSIVYRAFARTAMKRTTQRAIKEVTAKAKAQGKSVRPDIFQHTHLVPDDGGAIAQSVGVDEKAPHPVFILFDRSGKERARVSGEKALGRLSAVIEKL